MASSLVGRARAYTHTDQFSKLWRYGSVSVISTVLTNILLFLFFGVFSIASAIVCNILATTIVTVPAYWLNRTWTWKKSGRSDVWREVVPFWTIAFLSLVASTIAVGVTAHNADHITNSKTIKALLVDGANFVTYGTIWIVKFVIYNRYLFVDKDGKVEPRAGGDSEPAEAIESLSAASPVPAEPAMALAGDELSAAPGSPAH